MTTSNTNQPDSEINYQDDPALDQLLDTTLAPDAIEGGIPDSLAQRIFNASVTQLPIPLIKNQPTIIGRIGLLKRIAAIVLIGAGVSAAFIANSIVQQNNDAAQWQALSADFSQLAAAQNDTATNDNEQASLDLELNEVATTLDSDAINTNVANAINTWRSGTASLEAELDLLDMTEFEGSES